LPRLHGETAPSIQFCGARLDELHALSPQIGLHAYWSLAMSVAERNRLMWSPRKPIADPARSAQVVSLPVVYDGFSGMSGATGNVDMPLPRMRQAETGLVPVSRVAGRGLPGTCGS